MRVSEAPDWNRILDACFGPNTDDGGELDDEATVVDEVEAEAVAGAVVGTAVDKLGGRYSMGTALA